MDERALKVRWYAEVSYTVSLSDLLKPPTMCWDYSRREKSLRPLRVVVPSVGEVQSLLKL